MRSRAGKTLKKTPANREVKHAEFVAERVKEAAFHKLNDLSGILRRDKFAELQTGSRLGQANQGLNLAGCDGSAVGSAMLATKLKVKLKQRKKKELKQ